MANPLLQPTSSVLLESNQERFDEFFDKFYNMYKKSGASIQKAFAQKDYIKKIVEGQVEDANKGYDTLEEKDENTFYTKKNFIDASTLEDPTNDNDYKQNVYELDEDQGKIYVNTSAMFNSKVRTNKEYNKMFKDFGDKYLSPNTRINSSVLDWKSIDLYQDNIGSVKTITEFFFNMMMCYNNSVITKPKISRVGVPQSDWYVPLPEEWAKDGGLLDSIMKDGQIKSGLKNYGIKFDVGSPNQIKANVIFRDGSSTNANQDPGYTFPIYLETGLTNPPATIATIGKDSYDGGAFMTPFFSPEPFIGNIDYNNYGDTINNIRGIPNLGAGVNTTNPPVNLEDLCRGGGGLPHYYQMQGGQDIFGNNGLSNVSHWSGSRYRFLYDIVYSNPANSVYSSGFNLSSIVGYEQHTAISTFANPITRTNIGGFVSPHGLIPLLDNGQYGYLWDTHDIGIPATDNPSFAISVGNDSDINYPIPIYTNIWYNTARTAYNTYVLGKKLIPSQKYDPNNVLDVDPNIFNGSLHGRLGDFRPAQNNQASDYFTNDRGQGIKGNINVLKNILLSNFGGYLNNLIGANTQVDPPGLMRCRESERVAGGALHPPAILNNNLLPDTILNESQIKGIIEKFAETIFTPASIKPIYGGLSTAELNDRRDKFIARLFRAICIVRTTLFEMPIPSIYSNPNDPDAFLTKLQEIAYSTEVIAKGGNIGDVMPSPNDFCNLTLSNPDGTQSAQIFLNTRPDNVSYKSPPQGNYSDKFTNCNGQPITLSMTTNFREAFKTMVNKMIVTRQDVPTYDVSLAPENLYNDDSYVAWCTGNCRYLILPDVSSILNMKMGNKTYYDFLRDSLDSEYNLVQANFPDRLEETRKCSGGIVQEQKISKDTLIDLEGYMYKLRESKALLLYEIDNAEKNAKVRWNAEKEKYADVARIRTKKYISIAVEGLFEKDQQKLERGLRGVKGVYLENIQNFNNAYKKYLELDKQYQTKLNQINNQIETIIEKGTGVSIEPLEKEFNRIQDSKSINQSKFKEDYIKIRPYLIIPLEETAKYSTGISKLPPGTKGVSDDWKKEVVKQFEMVIRDMVDLGQSKIPFFREDFKEESDLIRLSKLELFVSEIKADDRIDRIKIPGNVNLPNKNVGIWVVYRTSRLGIKSYGLFDILNGKKIENITRRVLTAQTGILGALTDTKSGLFRGVIIFGKDKSNDWYFAPPPPAIIDATKLEEYRYELFNLYGKSDSFIIKDDDVKRAIFIYANFPLSVDELNRVKALFKPNLCSPNNAPTKSLPCGALMNIEDVESILLNIAKTYDKRNATDISFDRLVSNKEKMLKGGVKKQVKKKVKKSTVKKSKVKKMNKKRSYQVKKRRVLKKRSF